MSDQSEQAIPPPGGDALMDPPPPAPPPEPGPIVLPPSVPDPAPVLAPVSAPASPSWEDFVEQLWSDHVHGTILAGQTSIWNYMQEFRAELLARLKAQG